MSHNFHYTSVMSIYIERFVEMRKAAGFTYFSPQWILKEIDDFYNMESLTEAVITKEIYRKWLLSRRTDGDCRIYSKAVMWRQLAQFMCLNGVKCEIPVPPRPPKPEHEPYVLNNNQISAIFKAADGMSMRYRNYNTALFSIPAMFRFLYATGVRESEVVALNNEDLMIEQSVAIIKIAKNRRERYVPISPSLKEVILEYIEQRKKLPISNTNDPLSPLFIMPNGKRIGVESVYGWFRKAMDVCGIPYYGNRVGPVVHSLRHTYAVHALVKATRAGMDLTSSLPIISICLGHKSIAATEHYVRLTREMYPELIDKLQETTVNIFPELNNQLRK